VSLGIAIQNVPEGAIISMPMRAAGNHLSTIGFAVGFVLMMVLDVVMG